MLFLNDFFEENYNIWMQVTCWVLIYRKKLFFEKKKIPPPSKSRWYTQKVPHFRVVWFRFRKDTIGKKHSQIFTRSISGGCTKKNSVLGLNLVKKLFGIMLFFFSCFFIYFLVLCELYIIYIHNIKK